MKHDYNIKAIQRRLFVSMVLCSACFVKAVEISGKQAAVAAGNWIKRNPSPFDSRVGQSVLETRTHSDDSGDPLFHVVRFEEGGFVVTSADDGIQPFIVISSGDDLVADSRNPLWVMLNKDLPQRLAQVRTLSGQVQVQSAVSFLAEHEAEWQALLSDSDVSLSGLSSVSDLRVPPLVGSEWGQSTVSGKDTYNYYTPNDYACGCVATAGAQIMRYHQWPTASVSAGTYICFVNGYATSLTMQGGTYSWASMPLDPDYSITLTQRKAIGKLTYDVGVASYMSYASGGSGAYEQNLGKAFTERFGYASARVIMDQSSGVDGYLEQAVLSNLDAGFPVSLGLIGSAGGHQVIGDGYGYSSGDLYVHLNMGWSGSEDAWYNLPAVNGTYTFTVLGSILYNIFPEHSGEIISGRVLDSTGVPVSGATVVVIDETLGTTLPSVSSNDKGIYSVLVPEPSLPSTHSYSVTATSGSMIGEQSTTVTASESTTTIYYESSGGSAYYPGSGTVGNRWGVELILEEAPTLSYIAITGVTALNEGFGASYACTAYYSDNSSVDVTAAASWSENSVHASISSFGSLSVSNVTSDQSVTITVSYTDGDITETDTHCVTILDIPALSLPYAESFESGIGSWLASFGNDGDWQTNSGETDSSDTGPDGASDGSNYVYVEASTYGSEYVGNPNKSAAMQAVFDFSAMNSVELTFDYHMYGSDMGSLYVDVYDGSWHEGVWSRSGQQQAGSSADWMGAVVDLSAYAGTADVIIRVRGVTSDGSKSDIAVDNISLSGEEDNTVSFETWVVDEGIPEGLGGETNAPAGDGIANLLKYACGLTAMQPYSSSNLLSITGIDSGSFSVRYYKSKNTVGVTLEPIWTSLLTGSWTTTNITDVLVNDGAEIEERRAVIPLNGSGFIRLRATRSE